MSPINRGGKARDKQQDVVDASPGKSSPSPGKNLAESAVFRASQRGANRLLSNYRNVLATSFARMPRAAQEALVQRLCLIVTMGVTGLALLLFYPVIPRVARVFGVPAAAFAAWWAGNRVVTMVVLSRIERLLNTEF